MALKCGSRVNVNSTIRKLGYGFLFAFHITVAVSLAVSTQYTNVTQRETDIIARRHRPYLCIASRGKKTAETYTTPGNSGGIVQRSVATVQVLFSKIQQN